MKNYKFSASNIQSLYEQKKTTPDEAILNIEKSAKTITCGAYSATPNTLIKSFISAVKADNFLEVPTLFLFRSSENVAVLFKDKELLNKIHLELPFVGGAFGAILNFSNEHHLHTVEYIPSHFSKMSSGFLFNHISPPDVHMFQVSPMDQSGYFSFGVDGSYSIPMSKIAKKKIVEVNKYMPKTFGEGLIHISEIDMIVENDEPLGISASPSIAPESKAISEFILPFIKDGYCLQLGIGGIPDIIGDNLFNLNDLGVHTELLGGSMIELIANGNVTNKYKKTNRYHTVFNVCMLPTQEHYDFINNNPSILCYPADYVNDPDIIRQNDNVISVNSFVEIDLFGQVASESVNWKQITGTGGQVDFIRGATLSNGGKSFLAANSTAKNGTISKIVPKLNNIVTTARTDVEFVATEYGCVNIQGKTNRQRALALIQLAHPSFREQLSFEAQKINLI
ncbi:MAG: acetyl-CoA hydrolase/transferase C-terminal domain-containing protein [Alphaproteobacteria bacterium]|nr:acetyl-CoA hydrolase/transferase C-terminal domain-containing protein [Alphaproteobacteria bacterium]